MESYKGVCTVVFTNPPDYVVGLSKLELAIIYAALYSATPDKLTEVIKKYKSDSCSPLLKLKAVSLLAQFPTIAEVLKDSE